MSMQAYYDYWQGADPSSAKSELIKILAHVKQGKEIDWPQDGKPRPKEIKFSVGDADQPEADPKILKRYPSGSVKETRDANGVVLLHADKLGA